MYFDELTIGQRFKTEPITVTAGDIREFALKYDPLLIHTDPEFAEKSLYGGIIAPGLFTLCTVWGQWVRLNVVDREVIGGLGIDYLKWLAPVRPGDVLTADIEIADLIPSSKGGRGIIAVKAVASNQNGDAVLEAQLKGLIMCRE
jgi:acyl dehydratase